MAQDVLLGQIQALIMDSFMKITSKEVVFINGQMAEGLKVNGKTIRWKVTVCLHGLMEENMRVNILMIKRKGKEYSSGQMVENTMEIGSMESSMELEFILQLEERPKKENGVKGKEQNGLVDIINVNK
mgnify:CR=1 FL=1